MSEFDIIRHYFQAHTLTREDVTLGIGDDAAIVTIPAHHELVVTTDTLNEGVHFLKETSAFNIGHKSVAVNLSDLAAMGATPAWMTLALTLPSANQAWLDDFSKGLFSLAKQYRVALIGGDLTKGPLSISIQALGLIPNNQALLRSGAKPGDFIYISGTLGDAAFALHLISQNLSVHDSLLNRLHQPTPRIQLGEQLRGIAHAVIDISDGFAADLNHILEQSKVGARINVDQLPLSSALTQFASKNEAIHFALTGGDDYELCFTIPPEKESMLKSISEQLQLPLTRIGIITHDQTMILHHNNGIPYHGSTEGYQHFK